jgi:hypothetical protein
MASALSHKFVWKRTNLCTIPNWQRLPQKRGSYDFVCTLQTNSVGCRRMRNVLCKMTSLFADGKQTLWGTSWFNTLTAFRLFAISEAEAMPDLP